jgi:hypothetical protein
MISIVQLYRAQPNIILISQLLGLWYGSAEWAIYL